jgi:energy-coupling factor transporter ATP-binding protein EcfA2
MKHEMIEFSSNERMFITGKTGSGKTYFSRFLTRALPRLVVLDPKFSLGPWGLSPWNKESRKALAEGEDIRIRVTWTERGESEKFWDAVIWEVFETSNVVIYSDEIYSLSPRPLWMPEIMQRIYTQGRELGIGVIGVSQRPRFIPAFCMTESEHFIMFRLQKKDDRKCMSEYMGDQVIEPIPPVDPHGFYYYNVYWNDPIYIRKLETGHGEEGWPEFEKEIDDEES